MFLVARFLSGEVSWWRLNSGSWVRLWFVEQENSCSRQDGLIDLKGR